MSLRRSLTAQFLVYGALDIALSFALFLVLKKWVLLRLIADEAIRDLLSLAVFLILLLVPLWVFLRRALLKPLHALTEANQRNGLIPEGAIPAHELGRAVRSAPRCSGG